MAVSKTTKTAPGLRLARRVWRRFAEAGIFAPAQVSLEHQHLAHRYVVRGVEAGGAVADIGHYVTFAGATGEPLQYLHPLDAVGVNGVHAVVVAQALVRVEVFRSGRTYQALISKHSVGEAKNGRRPSIETEVLFKALDGYLDLELWGRDKPRSGSVLPQFFTPGGEPMKVPAAFDSALLAATKAACCIGCRHSHYLVADNNVAPREGEPASAAMTIAAPSVQEAVR
jgi:hypothetical protein